VHLRITPDNRLTNEAVEQFAQTLCVYQSPLERWNGRGVDRLPFVSLETVLRRGNTSFTVTVPRDTSSLARKAIETTWPNVTITETGDPLTIEPHLTCALEPNYHYMFAIKVDRREISLLSSLLETLNAMEADDTVYIQTLAIPAEKDWYTGAAEAYERFKAGQMPQKIALNKRTVGKTALKLATKTVLGAIDLVTELITGEEPDPIDLDGAERAAILRDGKLRTETLQKVRGDAFDVMIRVGVVCPDGPRAKAIMRMVTMAFRELDGDNHLVAHTTDPGKTWRKMRERSPGVRIAKDYLSIPEVSRLFLLPTRPLQEKYKLDSVKLLETGLPDLVTSGGLRLGEVTHKGATVPAYFPTDNWDELVLPRVVIGPMGCGKTRGFAGNFVVETVRNGFGCLAIDPAKGQIGDEAEAALPPDKVKRIRLGATPFALDFCEVRHSPRARNRLANAIISFFNTTADDVLQTARFLRAAVMGMKTGRLSEIVEIFENEAYLSEVIEGMPQGMHRRTLEQFKRETPLMKNRIVSPIYNRLDMILGDEYLAECLDSENSIDMVALMSEPQAVIFDVPKKLLGQDGVDIVVNLLSVKIDLAMTLREEEKQFPFFVLFDEPHQFLRSARAWKSAAVESRKWRVGYVWMFHSWEQIPNDLAEIIKSAGPHYHIYRASKKTFNDLKEELQPYSLDDYMRVPKWHAINSLRIGDEQQVVFISRMDPPPSEQTKKGPRRD